MEVDEKLKSYFDNVNDILVTNRGQVEVDGLKKFIYLIYLFKINSNLYNKIFIFFNINYFLYIHIFKYFFKILKHKF